MSRVHEALRRAEEAAGVRPPPERSPLHDGGVVTNAMRAAAAAPVVETDPFLDLLSKVKEIPFDPSQEALLIDAQHPHEAPTEEFRTLRTRLNHMQTLQPIHTAVVTSPSPAEGKSFAAVNLAMSQAQLAN